MFSVQRCQLPGEALPRRYEAQRDYVDCYTTVIRGDIPHAQFVEAFYTTLLFKLERLVLLVLLLKPSTDDDAHQLAVGQSNSFAAWTVESRADDQILVCDFLSWTRSWLMVAREDWDGDLVTRLYFGTVIVKRSDDRTGKRALSLFFKALLPFHMLYAPALLFAAKQRLKRRRISGIDGRPL